MMVFLERMRFLIALFFIIFDFQIAGMAKTIDESADFQSSSISLEDDLHVKTQTEAKDSEVSSYSALDLRLVEAVVGALAQKSYECIKHFNEVRLERNEYSQLLQDRYKDRIIVKKEDLEQDAVLVFKAIKTKLSEQMQLEYQIQRNAFKSVEDEKLKKDQLPSILDYMPRAQNFLSKNKLADTQEQKASKIEKKINDLKSLLGKKEQEDWLKAETLAQKIASNRVQEIFKKVIENQKKGLLGLVQLDDQTVLSLYAKTVAPPPAPSAPHQGSSGNIPDRDDKKPNTVVKPSTRIEDLKMYSIGYVQGPNGKPSIRYACLDTTTGLIIGENIISCDGSHEPMMVRYLESIPVDYQGCAGLRDLEIQHNQFVGRARHNANHNDHAFFQQMISHGVLSGRISIDQAIAYEKNLAQRAVAQAVAAGLKQEGADNAISQKQAAQQQSKSQQNQSLPIVDPVVDQSDTKVPEQPAVDQSAQKSSEPCPQTSAQKSQEATHQPDFPSISPSTSDDSRPKTAQDDEQASMLEKQRQQLLNHKKKWMAQHDVDYASSAEKTMIDSLFHAMEHAQNDTAVECAQASLQAWLQAKESKSDELYEYYKNRSKKLHDYALSRANKSMIEQAQPITQSQLADVLHNYTQALDHYRTTSVADRTTHDAAFYDRLEKRVQALQQSQEQIKTNTPSYQNHTMSDQARAYLMVNNMNYAAFEGKARATEIQHCLTKEIIGIIESSAAMSAGNDPTSKVSQFARYNCDLAVTAQKLNRLSRIKQAAALVDINHLFELYGQHVLNNKEQGQAIGAMTQGALKSVYTWGEFFVNLGTQPQQTIGEIIKNCKTIGSALHDIAATVYEFTPAAYLDDLYDDYGFNPSKNHDDCKAHPVGAMWKRTEKNLNTLHNGWVQSLQVAHQVIEEMMKKSPQDNLKDASEIIFDGLITDQATILLGKLCRMAGNKALQAADRIGRHMPTNLLDSPVKFMQASNGQVIAIAEKTGESVGAAVAAQRVTDLAEQAVKNAAKANELSKKLDELTKPDKEKIEKLHKELEVIKNATEIINAQRLIEISKTVPQVDDFRIFTNNFKDLEKLQSNEILYLNLCDWLEPQAVKINAQVKKMGLKITEIKDGITCVTDIYEFDIFHSLLGEMRPGSVKDATSGGHWFLSELKVATFEIDKIESFREGFFDISVKHIRGNSANFRTQTCFPSGSTIEDCINKVVDVIQNYETINNISNTSKNLTQQAFQVSKKNLPEFVIRIENYKAKFYPVSPLTW